LQDTAEIGDFHGDRIPAEKNRQAREKSGNCGFAEIVRGGGAGSAI
jgi:hypothetical protein